MDAFNCPEKIGVILPPYHQTIIEKAIESGRYGNISEFVRECIEEHGERKGFTPSTDSSLSHRTRDGHLNRTDAGNVCSIRGEQCLKVKEEA